MSPIDKERTKTILSFIVVFGGMVVFFLALNRFSEECGVLYFIWVFPTCISLMVLDYYFRLIFPKR